MKSTVKYWSEEKYSSVLIWDLHRLQGPWELWYQVCTVPTLDRAVQDRIRLERVYML